MTVPSLQEKAYHTVDGDETLSRTSSWGRNEQTFDDKATESDHLPQSPTLTSQAEQSLLKDSFEDAKVDAEGDSDWDDFDSQHDEDEDDITGNAVVVLQRHANADAGAAAIPTESLNGGTINDDHDDNAKHDQEHALTSVIDM